MIDRIHFISGLPRSGSTLLSALLRQNPRFTAAISSPVYRICGSVHDTTMHIDFKDMFDEERRAVMLRGIFNSYYGAVSDKLVFDTNRSWTARLPLLGRLYPQSRVICCVRDIGWIIDSFEKVFAKNPLDIPKMFSGQPAGSVYARSEIMMNITTGVVGLPWSNLREAWFGSETNRLIVIPYDNLAKHPQRTLERLYQELNEPLFEHDLNHLDYDEPQYDADAGMPGLHKVRPRVEFQAREPIIPPDLFKKYESTHFWDKPELNPRHIKII